MKHAEEIAERLDYLGGVPTTKPEPIKVGKNAQEMIKINKKAEEDAIVLYREIIALAEKEGDTVTVSLFTDILAEEEEHHNTFTSLLSE
jgi:bacterioferritin